MSLSKRLVAGGTAVAGSLTAATGYLALNDWFGAGDLYGMVLWSLPVGLGVFWLLRFRVFAGSTHIAIRYVAAIVAGLLLGVGWTAVAAIILGGWILAFSFPVAICWLFGAVTGLTFGLVVDWPGSWPGFAAAGTISVVAVVGAFNYYLTPPPAAVLYLPIGATPQEVERVWQEVLGVPHPSGQGFGLRDGLQGVANTGITDDQATLTVIFRKGVGQRRIQVLLDSITASPLVQRAEQLPPGEPVAFRRSVEY